MAFICDMGLTPVFDWEIITFPDAALDIWKTTV
jgi:hypothetical protein